MRLYHFTNAEYGLSNLREKHLKISRIDQLNDPFEFMGADLSNGDLRKEIEISKDRYNETMGLLCFSKNWDNPVQWGHYADGHKGLCLGFDVADGAIGASPEIAVFKGRLHDRRFAIEKNLVYKPYAPGSLRHRRGI